MTRGLWLAVAFSMGITGASAQGRIPLHWMPAATAISGESPFSESCDAGQPGTHYRHAAVEAWLAADPADPQHLVGSWQQDRWSNGGASGLVAAVSFDGGRSWRQSIPPFSLCSGGDKRYLRASDPWVTISPDGSVYYIGLSLTGTGAGSVMLVSKSGDGGLHWGNPVTLIQDLNPDILDDKESITADPLDARYVYAVWDRLTGLTSSNTNNFRGPTYLARTSDGGATWEPARAVFDPGPNAQTIGNQVVVLPDGTVVDIFELVQNAGAPLVRDERLSFAIIRSTDKGATWSSPITVANPQPVGVSNVKTNVPVRSGAGIPSIAVDPVSGALYVVWEDGRFSGGMREGIAMTRSSDGGLTWSTPAQINQAPDVQAFTPSVSVSRAGVVSVTYYDFRKDTDARNTLLTSYWRLISNDQGATWSEAPLSEPFDLSAAAMAGGYFIGDYQGLAAAGDAFIALFVASGKSGVPSQVFAATRPTGGDARSNGRTEINRILLRRRVEKRK